MQAERQNRSILRDRELRLMLESGLLGVAGALSAQLFMWMLRGCNRLLFIGIAGYQPPGAEIGPDHQVIGAHELWLIHLVTTLGGLLSGFLYRFAPEAEGHGTDTAVEAFHRREGIIRPRVPPVKMLASAITIGSGGAAGREGPIALITAGMASVYAKLAHHSEEDSRLCCWRGWQRALRHFSHAHGDRRFRHRGAPRTHGVRGWCAALHHDLRSRGVYRQRPVCRVPASVPRARHRHTRPFNLCHLRSTRSGGRTGGNGAAEVFYRIRDGFRRLPVPVWTVRTFVSICQGAGN